MSVTWVPSKNSKTKIGDLESFRRRPATSGPNPDGVDGIDRVDFASKYQTAKQET